jgi:caffeoyl-CoA O-methyltransferase
LNITDPKIDAYLKSQVPKGDDVRAEMERLGAEKEFPIIGPAVGQLCSVLARSIGAKKVFECGSGFGYSTWWFANAVGADGLVHHTDGSQENSDLALDLLGQAGLASRVTFHVGDAREALKAVKGPFDVIFNDIDKEGYPDLLPLVREKLRVGGYFITDNMLWFGRVLAPAEDDSTRGIQKLTADLKEADDFTTTIIPIRDGVSVSLRVG